MNASVEHLEDFPAISHMRFARIYCNDLGERFIGQSVRQNVIALRASALNSCANFEGISHV